MKETKGMKETRNQNTADNQAAQARRELDWAVVSRECDFIMFHGHEMSMHRAKLVLLNILAAIQPNLGYIIDNVSSHGKGIDIYNGLNMLMEDAIALLCDCEADLANIKKERKAMVDRLISEKR